MLARILQARRRLLADRGVRSEGLVPPAALHVSPGVVLPLIERIFLRGARDFAMIGAYSMNFGDCAFFADMLRHHGLEVEYRKYFFGCATGVVGRKPVRGATPAA